MVDGQCSEVDDPAGHESLSYGGGCDEVLQRDCARAMMANSIEEMESDHDGVWTYTSTQDKLQCWQQHWMNL